MQCPIKGYATNINTGKERKNKTKNNIYKIRDRPRMPFTEEEVNQE